MTDRVCKKCGMKCHKDERIVDSVHNLDLYLTGTNESYSACLCDACAREIIKWVEGEDE